VKTLKLYRFTVEILDDTGEVDAEMLAAMKTAVTVHMEAIKIVVTLVDSTQIQVAVDEFGRPILAEA
jgi:uncharacterized protein YjgD (DUF1641 family)